MTPQRFTALGLLVVALVFSSQTLSSKALRATEESLYERLGGTYPIAVVVDDFMNRVIENGTLNANPAIDAARKTVPFPVSSSRSSLLWCKRPVGPRSTWDEQ